jgi:hypothetical protein
MTHDYDVAFSYAGEDRGYVQAVHDRLVLYGVRVFYDGGEAAVPDLWGKNLYEYLTDVYSRRARFCVIFLSRAYAEKLWTRHELKAAQARAFADAAEYILPARFDDTEIPGLLGTVAYVDLRSKTPETLATLVKAKVDRSKVAPATAPDNGVLSASGPTAFLADAVIYADEYLQPQALDLADEIARAVRRSFAEASRQITREALLPYLRSERASHRVVAYIAFQVSPHSGMALELVAGLRREKTEALARQSTKPLWQLLVCIGKWTQQDVSDEDRALVRRALKHHLDWLRQQANIDPGGQCKRRIHHLLGKAVT